MNQENAMDRETLWGISTLADLDAEALGEFYDDVLESDEAADAELGIQGNFLGFGNSDLFTSPRMEVAVMEDDGTVSPAQAYSAKTPISDSSLNLYMERYFAHEMPGRHFDLQLGLGARHVFSDRPDEEEPIAHTLPLKGTKRDYMNYMSEPVFRNLSVQNVLTLDLSVTYVSDKFTRGLLEALDSETLGKGVALAKTFNPVYGTITSYATSLVKMFAQGRKNRGITDFHFSLVSRPGGHFSMPLVEATYLLFQPSYDEGDGIDLSELKYDHDVSRLVRGDEVLDRNHLFLRIEASPT